LQKEQERKRPRGKGGKKLLLAALIIATCAAFVAGLSDISDFDIWYHLKTGELILSEKHIPFDDVFSYTASGKPWVVHEWLSEVLFAVVYGGSGAAGLIVLKAIVLALSAGLLLSLALRGRGTTLPFLLFPLFLFPLTLRAFERPDIFTLLFVCILLVILLRAEEGKGKRSLFFIPALFLLWANMHSGVTLGLLVLACFTLGSHLSRGAAQKVDRTQGGGQPRVLLRVLLMSIAASLLNPNHVKALLYPFWLARSPVFTKVIGELKGPLDPEYAWAFWQVGFLALIPVTLAVLLVTSRVRNLSLILPLVLFLVLSFFAHRNVPLFAAVALAVAATAGLREAAPQKNRPRSGSENLPHAGRIMACIIPALAGVLVLAKGAYMGEEGWRQVGTSVNESQFPVGAVRFLEEESIDGNMFNMMGWGGYLVYHGYPGRKVFIDGRLDLYGEEFSRRYLDAYFLSSGIEKLLKEYDIGYFVLDYPDQAEARMIQYPLSQNPDWALVYWDDNSLVYVRNDSTYAPVVERLGYRSVNPVSRTVSQVFQQAKKDTQGFVREVERQLAGRPETAISQVFLAIGYEVQENYAGALSHYERALAMDPSREDLRNKIFVLRAQDETQQTAEKETRERKPQEKESPPEDAPSALAEGMAFLQQNKFEAARDALLRAAAESPNDANIFYNLAFAYRQLRNEPEARKNLDRALALNPGHADSHNDLGIIEAMAGNYEAASGHFMKALATDPNRVPTLMNLALTQLKTGDTATAVETLDRILRVEPGNEKARRKLDELVNPLPIPPPEAGG
jgi:tetratricopeptide (TPR) repeat protein